MFYSQYILTKKGPLGKIWLAAHTQNKLTKAMVFSVDLVKSCDKIINPEAPMALRLTSNLLLGVVRVYSRKARYLLSDCSDAVSKIKIAFKVVQAPVDLPEETATAPYNQITFEDGGSSRLRLEGNGFDLSLDRMASLQLELNKDYQADEEDITMPITAGVGVHSMMDTFGVEYEQDRDSLGEEDDEEGIPLSFEPVGVDASSPTAVEQPKETQDECQKPGIAPGTMEVERETIATESALIPEPELGRQRVSDRFSLTLDDVTLGPDDEETILDDVREVEHQPLDVSMPADITFDHDEDGSAKAEEYRPQESPAAEDLEIPLSAVRPRRRRRPIAARFDRETELPGTVVRAAMRDTSDILRKPKRRRVGLEAIAVTPSERILLPVIVEMKGPLLAMYRQCMSANLPLLAADMSAGTEPRTPPRDGMQANSSLLDDVELAREQPIHRPDDAMPNFTPTLPTLEEQDVSLRLSGELPTTLPASMGHRDESMDQCPEYDSVELPRMDRIDADGHALSEMALTHDDERTSEGRNARQEKLKALLQRRFESEGPRLNITDMLRSEKKLGANGMRRTAARTFVELLSLSNAGLICISQDRPYGNINVVQTEPAVSQQA